MFDQTTLLQTTTLSAIALIIYHHAGYPLLLRAAARPPAQPAPLAADDLPAITLILPAHNEARHIARKLRNLAELDYPRGKLEILILCDGCTDATAALARATLAEPACQNLTAQIIEFEENRGKVTMLKEGFARAAHDIVAVSDISATLPADALIRAAAHFADPKLGAVGGTYRLAHPGSDGEAAYWRMQLAVKRGEAALGAPLGLHGAFYAVRRNLVRPLDPSTINDDFILPMQLLLAGHRIAYDDRIVALELERAAPELELRRRRRIAAGNAQQLFRLPGLLNPLLGGPALCFASGKALRVVMPFLFMLVYLCSLGLAVSDARDAAGLWRQSLWGAAFGLQTLGLALAIIGLMLGQRAPRLLRLLAYLMAGHTMSGLGVIAYLRGVYARPWQRSNAIASARPHVPHSVAIAKRGLDILIASIALVLTAPLWPLIALAIRLTSPGPAIFRQSRIGRARGDRVEIFQMMKFRTMYQDAEARSGAVWASKNDPRITPVGRFLRKTRLDEIPQLINVLHGDMSIVGPRPERPGFYARLENAIPFFAARTDGLRPGITGLAQVRQGYDTNLDDVRRKVSFDHAYGMRLTGLTAWLTLDLSIMLRTLTVMATGRGQ